MVIKSQRDVWFFTMTITVIAMSVAEMLNYVLFPPSYLPRTMIGTAFIVVSVTVPISLWIGEEMRETTRLNAKLRYMVNHDRLTQLGTREHFFTTMKQLNGEAGVMLMLDLDHFKTINDTHGHLAGDEMIKTAATAIRLAVRSSDVTCRFGGEEFVIFLPTTALSDGFTVAEAVREKIATNEVIFDGATLNVTASIGGVFKHPTMPYCAALKLADTAMYRAKTQGRNRTLFAAQSKSTSVNAA